MQFNIWKISIVQRKSDEVFLSSVMLSLLIFSVLLLNQKFSMMFRHESEFFSNDVQFHPELLENVTPQKMKEFCEVAIIESEDIYQNLS